MIPPFVPLALAWLVGLWVAEWLPIPLWGWVVALLITLMVLLLYFLRTALPRPYTNDAMLMALLMGIFALGGASRGAVAGAQRSTLADYNDSGVVTLIGTVDRYPEQRATYTSYVITADGVGLSDRAEMARVQGAVVVNLPPYPAYTYGDQLQLTGRLLTPPRTGEFDYRTYLAVQGIHSTFRATDSSLVAQGRGTPLLQLLNGFRTDAAQTIRQLLPEPHAALLNGIVLGLNGAIPENIQTAFNTTGTTHVLVISGANFSVLVGALNYGGRRLAGRRWNGWWVVGSIALYALLVGGEPPVVRAAIMGGIAVYATMTRRVVDGVNSLAVAIVAFTLLAPAQRADVGFQLSALATLGLIGIVPHLRRMTEIGLQRLKLPATMHPTALNVLTESLLLTLAAQLATTPLIVSTFGRLSLVSLLTNILIVPVQPLIMQVGLAAMLLGMLWTPLGQIAAIIPYAGLTWTLAVVEQTARIPFASVAIEGVSPVWVWLVYSLIGVGYWWMTVPNVPPPKSPFVAPPLLGLTRRTVLIAGGIFLIIGVVGWGLRYRPDGKLHLYTLDVGQGDALLVVTPDGKQILLDGGPDSALLLQEVGDVLPFWDRTIDLVVLTHPDQDHLGGLPELLARYEVGAILTSGDAADSRWYEAWEAAVSAEGVTPMVAQAGTQIQAGTGVIVEVLAPRGTPFATPNENSVVVRVGYGAFCALLTGDIEAESEQRLLAENAMTPCQVLKVAHHGSATSTTAEFLAATTPQYALISAGSDNRYGHPAPDVLARLAARNIRIFRTDQQGTLHLWTDGQSLWAETER